VIQNGKNKEIKEVLVIIELEKCEAT